MGIGREYFVLMSKILQKRCVFERLSVKNGHHEKNNLSHAQILLVFGHQTKKKLPMSKIAISNFHNVNINRRRALLILISSLEVSQHFLGSYFVEQRDSATDGRISSNGKRICLCYDVLLVSRLNIGILELFHANISINKIAGVSCSLFTT